MINLALGKPTPAIGVDIGRHSVKLVQMDRVGSEAALAVSSRYALPEHLDLKDEGYHQWVATAVKHALEQGEFAGKRCVSVLPPACVEVKNLRLPPMPADEMREAVAWEMRDRLKAAEGTLSVQYLSAGEVRQGDETREEIIGLAVETVFVERHVEALVSAGLAPLAVDVEVSALARAFAPQFPEGVAVVVDVGFSASKLMILNNGRVVFYKRIDVAGRELDQRVSEQLSIPRDQARALRREAQASTPQSRTDDPVQRALHEALRPAVGDLAREIELCLRYFGVTFRGARPESLTLVGGEALHVTLPAMLSEQTGLDVRVGDPLHGLGGADAALWAVATGLAVRTDADWGNRRTRGRAAA